MSIFFEGLDSAKLAVIFQLVVDTVYHSQRGLDSASLGFSSLISGGGIRGYEECMALLYVNS